VTNVGFVLAFALSAGFALAFTPLVRAVAARLNILEKPNGRTSRDIAHIGGAGIIGAILFALIPVFLFAVDGGALERSLIPVLIASGFLVFLLGIIDDLRSLHYFYKLVLQISVSVFVASVGLALLDHFEVLRVPLYVLVPLFGGAAVWMLVVTTSFNLIDGLDGLAAGLACIAGASFAAAGIALHQPLAVVLALVACGASLGFLRYNYPPASIFMGDSGSLFLGLIFGLVSLLLLIPGTNLFFRIAGNVVVLGVPILDTALAFSRRLATRRPVFEADHRHLHHMLLYRLRSVRKVDAVLWSLAAVFGALGVLTMRGSVPALCAASALIAGVYVFALRRMVRFSIGDAAEEKILGACGIVAPTIAPRER
jgi:UDP-GlcNAc:undecaprenyl-phosphate GlcNAc-1-phosphate transferase